MCICYDGVSGWDKWIIDAGLDMRIAGHQGNILDIKLIKQTEHA